MMLASMTVSRAINAYRNPAKLDFERILFIRMDEIGDMIYSTHIFEMVRKQFPKAKITLLCKSYGKALLKSDRNIDEIITSWADLKGSFDLIVDLKSDWKSIGYSLKAWPKIRLDRGTVRVIDAAKGEYPHEVITNYQIIAPIISEKNKNLQPHIALSDDDLKAAEQFIADHELGSFTLLHINARRTLRKWPLQNFCQLANYLHNEKKLSVVFIGDESEAEEIAAAQKQLAFKTFSTAGNLSLTQLAALMKKATIYIGNESGPLHMAAIMQVPCLGLYGPGPVDIFYPYGKKTAVIHHVLECNPCDQLHCVHPENPCIQRITLEEVKSKITEFL